MLELGVEIDGEFNEDMIAISLTEGSFKHFALVVDGCLDFGLWDGEEGFQLSAVEPGSPSPLIELRSGEASSLWELVGEDGEVAAKIEPLTAADVTVFGDDNSVRMTVGNVVVVMDSDAAHELSSRILYHVGRKR